MVHALSGDLYRYAYMLCRDRAMAEDLVQETFARAWRYLDGLRDEARARSWLMTTVRREFARQFERYQPPIVDVETDDLPGRTGSETDAIAVRRALLALPVKYREVLVLQVIGGYSGDEMAQMLEMPRATVNTRLFRARQRLRAMLESGLPATGDTQTEADDGAQESEA